MTRPNLNDQPYKGPGRLIFWVLVSLAFVAMSVWQNLWYANHDNLTGMAVYLVLGLVWTLNLYWTLDRWYVPKELPQPVPTPRSNTLEDEE